LPVLGARGGHKMGERAMVGLFFWGGKPRGKGRGAGEISFTLGQFSPAPKASRKEVRREGFLRRVGGGGQKTKRGRWGPRWWAAGMTKNFFFSKKTATRRVVSHSARILSSFQRDGGLSPEGGAWQRQLLSGCSPFRPEGGAPVGTRVGPFMAWRGGGVGKRHLTGGGGFRAPADEIDGHRCGPGGAGGNLSPKKGGGGGGGGDLFRGD